MATRITEKEKEAILTSILIIDPNANVWLFGSRADDSKRGGDIDILIESQRIGFKEKQQIRLRIQDLIGDQKIDLLIVNNVKNSTSGTRNSWDHN